MPAAVLHDAFHHSAEAGSDGSGTDRAGRGSGEGEKRAACSASDLAKEPGFRHLSSTGHRRRDETQVHGCGSQGTLAIAGGGQGFPGLNCGGIPGIIHHQIPKKKVPVKGKMLRFRAQRGIPQLEGQGGKDGIAGVIKGLGQGKIPMGSTAEIPDRKGF